MGKYIFYIVTINVLTLAVYIYSCSPTPSYTSYSNDPKPAPVYDNTFQNGVSSASLDYKVDSSNYQAPPYHGVPSSGSKSRTEPEKLKKCIRDDIGKYTSSELKSLATFYPFNEISKEVPSLLVGGSSSCNFDTQTEKCSWYSGGKNKFKIGGYESLFDLNKFDCTSNRDFNVDNYFLIGSVFNEEHIKNDEEFINLDLDVPCQFGKATLSFNYWCNTEIAQLEICVILKDNGMEVCEPTTIDENPLTFEIPENLKPFVIRLHVRNIDEDKIIFIDDIKYQGQLCENVDNNEEVNNETLVRINENDVKDDRNPRKLKEILDNNKSLRKGKSESSFVTEDYNDVEDRTIDESLTMGTTLLQKENKELCNLLWCNFNDNSTCNYNPFSELATEPWKVSLVGIGNPLNGIHKRNHNDDQNSSYFAVAGSDDDRNDGDSVYIMESPSFTSHENFLLVFDIYQRSVGVNFLVCLDSFENCPYKNPPIDKDRYWFTDERVLIEKHVKKIYFVIDLIKPHQFFGLDNIRLQTTNGNQFEDICKIEK
uniref:MAM domain-containing protein n=1 Tax=Strongyloides papillosus TaxID=174720 RepID=A0A0N5BEC0_STREA